jgi:hypothetical protein
MPFTDVLLPYIKDIFLETGSFEGDTIDIVLKSYRAKKLISIELSDVFHERCRKRFENNPEVSIVKGNSRYDLYNTIKDINTPITFWLDSHWSGVPDSGCDPITVCPVLEELAQIRDHPIKTHTIMVDDIRLMNVSDDKYNGFPISLDQIKESILDINPNYTIKLYDDWASPNDVLVAYIEEKVSIHKYLVQCKTNPQPPGFADYLRGTVAMYNISKQYGYKLLLDNTHPLFKYIRQHKNHITYDSDNLSELLPPYDYPSIYNKLNELFSSGKSFATMTNSFYSLKDGRLDNWGPISEDCREYLKETLAPSTILSNNVDTIIRTVYKVEEGEKFKAVHIRFGDRFIHTNMEDENAYNIFYNKISRLLAEDSSFKYVLLTDSSAIGSKLQANIPGLGYWDNKKVHLGDLRNNEGTALLDTLTDFFILSRASEIVSDISFHGSGFSTVAALIFDIPYRTNL